MGEVLAKSHKAKFMGAVLCLCLTLKGTALAGTEPEVKALGAVLMEAESGRVLWEKNAEAPLPNASTTKSGSDMQVWLPHSRAPPSGIFSRPTAFQGWNRMNANQTKGKAAA